MLSTIFSNNCTVLKGTKYFVACSSSCYLIHTFKHFTIAPKGCQPVRQDGVLVAGALAGFMPHATKSKKIRIRKRSVANVVPKERKEL